MTSPAGPAFSNRLDDFVPYAWETSSAALAEDLGLPLSAIVRFDTNTSPYGGPLPVGAVDASEYPDPSYRALMSALASYAGVDRGCISVGAGADEVLDTVCRAVLDPGDAAVACTPTYSYFGVCVQRLGARAVPVPRDGLWELDVDAIRRQKPKAVYACNPNNPTGNASPASTLDELLSMDAWVVLDEAYVEFCRQNASLARRIAECPNLVVVRTLSKAWGLAGARVGYALCNPDAARILETVRPPNGISAYGGAAALSALSEPQSMRQNVQSIVRERKRLQCAFESLGFDVAPSETNFLLIRRPDVAGIYRAWLDAGLVVRSFSDPRLADALRVTVRRPEQNDRLLEGLE